MYKLWIDGVKRIRINDSGDGVWNAGPLWPDKQSASSRPATDPLVAVPDGVDLCEEGVDTCIGYARKAGKCCKRVAAGVGCGKLQQEIREECHAACHVIITNPREGSLCPSPVGERDTRVIRRFVGHRKCTQNAENRRLYHPG